MLGEFSPGDTHWDIPVLWMLNQPHPNVPPSEIRFNKALLRETNG